MKELKNTNSSFAIGKGVGLTTPKYVTTTGIEAIRDWVNEKFDKLKLAPLVEHKCHNCGGVLEIETTKHIFICPFCKSVYAIGTEMVNDHG